MAGAMAASGQAVRSGVVGLGQLAHSQEAGFRRKLGGGRVDASRHQSLGPSVCQLCAAVRSSRRSSAESELQLVRRCCAPVCSASTSLSSSCGSSFRAEERIVGHETKGGSCNKKSRSQRQPGIVLPRASGGGNGEVGVATVADNADVSSSSMTTTVGGDGGLQICRILNGMWQTSGGWGRIEPSKAVAAMFEHVDNGLTTFDMADHYGPAEDLFGLFHNQALRERGEEYASKVQGLTKWCPSPVKMTRSVVEQNIDRSRKRMDVKRLDMLQFHWWDYANPGYLDALKHMQDLKEEGKIAQLSLTNFDTKRLQIILENGISIASNQVQYSLVDQRPDKEMAKLCQMTGVKLITYGTVLGGLLSEKYLGKGQPGSWGGPTLNTPSLNKYKRMVDVWGGWELFQQLLRECNTIAKKHGVSMATVGLRFVLDQSAVGGSMVGVRLGIAQHIEDSKKVFGLKLDEDDRQRLETVTGQSRDLLVIIGDCGDEYRG
ncbi:hypothetical protein CBR_g10840 [Chara braunii]|uniref:NADP-dependent oxidoreductase domain-containing protein n=1 Tax=Chara braunii TaxID=69332 RepID=A0A388KPC4_CHABU|nr:hypothetical protein CBR_g10840 [Chara braunii]|eukprot:GBG71904.1 hypothetical protein CBR_g10840 [Chara braunii]